MRVPTCGAILPSSASAKRTELDDYALFRALKTKYRGACYFEWPAPLLERRPAALISARRELATEVEQVRFAQFLLFRQWQRLGDHAAEKGVRLIGDLPFYVSLNSSDVWANPQMFLLDAQHRPRFVASVPPDYFSAQGQLWGNPVYDWAALQPSGYRWAIDRLSALLAVVDAVRLDHFRGFAAAWHVPAGAATAQTGQWVPGPGAEFFTAASRELGELPVHRRRFGTDHARCRRPPRPVSPARSAGAAIRFRRQIG